jgi:hypothetical protein
MDFGLENLFWHRRLYLFPASSDVKTISFFVFCFVLCFFYLTHRGQDLFMNELHHGVFKLLEGKM